MTTALPTVALQLRSLVLENQLELSLAQIPVPDPGPDEVLVRIEAAPLNPSDIGLLFGPADMAAAEHSGSLQRPIVHAPIPAPAMKSMAGRLQQSLPVGNEGAGVVVKAGSLFAAQSLLGRTVAVRGGCHVFPVSMSQRRSLPAAGNWHHAG